MGKMEKMTSREKKKILIVDDEAMIRDMLNAVFTEGGYKVFTAENAETALMILGAENIMVMFLDLSLPGVNGIELCKKIRKENQIGILYAFTGYSNIFGLLECRAAGFDDFFEKPTDIKILLKAAGDAFEKLERWKASELDLA
jgi:DNA-binding response OmpR family regulator